MLRIAVGLCGALLVSILPAHAQVLYASIVGNIREPSEARIPGAAVSIVNRETGQSRQTTTNDSGGYAFPTIPTGVYDLKVIQSGFAAITQTEVSVTINNVTRVDVRLQVGTVNESVMVTAQ